MVLNTQNLLQSTIMGLIEHPILARGGQHALQHWRRGPLQVCQVQQGSQQP